MAIGDTTVGIDAVVGRRQAVVTNAVLAVAQLANGTRSITRGREVEAAAVTTANKGVGTGSESSEGDEGLHHGKRGLLEPSRRKKDVGR